MGTEVTHLGTKVEAKVLKEPIASRVSNYWEVIEMAMETTLTIRLPDDLRQRLDREASVSDRSLDSVVIDFIRLGLKARESAHEKDQRERELEAIAKTGLVEPLGEGWEAYLAAAREIAHEEVREMLAGLSPFSADIIAERDEGR